MHVKRVAGALGAELKAVNLGEGLDTELAQTLRALLNEHEVLFIRDQSITPADQKALAEIFGPLQTHPAYQTVEALPEVMILESTRENPSKIEQWHSDMTFRVHPPSVTVLRGMTIPEVGGDTLFVDAYAAYGGLAEETKELIDGLVASHDFLRAFARQVPEEKRDEIRQRYPVVEHPVVISHHQTGKPLLYVNRIFVSGIKGWDQDRSYELIDLLCREFEVLEYSCRFRWEPNSIAFWDNQAVQHYATSDYSPHKRVMERASIKGSQPTRR